ncbi:ensconsin isoform X1, partial [Tachysurus ichikawai]
IPQTTQHIDSNGHANPDLLLHTLPPAGHDASTEALRENGIIMETFEEVIEVPMVTKLSRQEGDGEEEDETMKAPLIAFRENGSTHDMSAWDQSQVQQHAVDTQLREEKVNRTPSSLADRSVNNRPCAPCNAAPTF